MDGRRRMKQILFMVNGGEQERKNVLCFLFLECTAILLQNVNFRREGFHEWNSIYSWFILGDSRCSLVGHIAHDS